MLDIDLGMNVRNIVGLDETGAVLLPRRAKRETLIGLAAKLPSRIVVMGVELHHPVAPDLQPRAADLRRLGARGAVINRCERKKSSSQRRMLGLLQNVAPRRQNLSGTEQQLSWQTSLARHVESDLCRFTSRHRVTLGEIWYDVSDQER